MILTREEISFLDVYCHEGTEVPFGGPVTDVMTRMGIQNGDTLNLQWAYLRDKPPTGPVIGHASKVAPPLPWADRDAVLRRDAEIRAIREEMQRASRINLPRQESGIDDSREAIYTRMEGE
jgi:hypothetical protein